MCKTIQFHSLKSCPVQIWRLGNFNPVYGASNSICLDKTSFLNVLTQKGTKWECIFSKDVWKPKSTIGQTRARRFCFPLRNNWHSKYDGKCDVIKELLRAFYLSLPWVKKEFQANDSHSIIQETLRWYNPKQMTFMCMEVTKHLFRLIWSNVYEFFLWDMCCSWMLIVWF